MELIGIIYVALIISIVFFVIIVIISYSAYKIKNKKSINAEYLSTGATDILAVTTDVTIDKIDMPLKPPNVASAHKPLKSTRKPSVIPRHKLKKYDRMHGSSYERIHILGPDSILETNLNKFKSEDSPNQYDNVKRNRK